MSAHATRAAAARWPRDRAPDSARTLLVAALDAAYRGPAWYGPSVRFALRGLTAESARRRPGPGRPSAWEQLLHVAYAKHRVLARVTGERGARFPRPIAHGWWPALPVRADAAAWAADLALADACHERLRDATLRAPAARLAARRPGKSFTIADEIAGAAQHDAYHAGQLRLARALIASRDAALSRRTRG